MGGFRGASGAMRGGDSGDSDDEDINPGGGQRIGFEEGAISFDQVGSRLLCLDF
jgi:hypothetical protein